VGDTVGMKEEPYAQKDLLSAEDVAEYLGVGAVTVYRWCKEGRLRCIKLGKHWRIRREVLEDFLRQRERPATPSGELSSLLDTLSTHVAIIKGTGDVVAVNGAWRAFAESNGAVLSKVVEGTNYLRVCESARGDQSEYAGAFAEGLRSVLSGELEEFEMEYPCHSPDERRWFVGRVLPFRNGSTPQAVVIHENITERKRMKQQLEHLAQEFELRGIELGEPIQRDE
jgi:excisionase family DNA binding protein